MLAVSQSFLFGAAKKSIIPDSPPTRFCPSSIWINDGVPCNCKHHQCCGCGFYSKKLNLVAQNLEEVNHRCPLRHKDVLDPI